MESCPFFGTLGRRKREEKRKKKKMEKVNGGNSFHHKFCSSAQVVESRVLKLTGSWCW